MAESIDAGPALVLGPVGRVIAWACKVLALLGGALFLIESLMSLVSVAGRTLIEKPVQGDYELVQMMSAAGIAMCLPYCQLRKGHVFVDFFTLWAPPALKRVLDALAMLLLAAVSFLLAWRVWDGLLTMREYGETSMVLGLPIWWGYVPVMPSLALLGITSLLTFFHELRSGGQR